MKQPEAFRRFTGGFYEDIFYEAPTVDGVVRLLLAQLTPEQQSELLAYLDHLTGTMTASEIKGILNRANMRFDTKRAMEVVATCAAQIRTSL